MNRHSTHPNKISSGHARICRVSLWRSTGDAASLVEMRHLPKETHLPDESYAKNRKTKFHLEMPGDGDAGDAASLHGEVRETRRL